MRAHLPVLFVLLALSSSAFAAPAATSVQGFVRTSGGAPADGTYSMEFRLFTVATGGTAAFTATVTGVAVEAGLFDVALDLPPALLAGPLPLWLETVVEGEVLPRQPLRSVPLAAVASEVACSGCVSAAEVAFPYAGSDAKGGAAIDLACSGCVEAGEIAGGAIATVHLQAGSVTAQKVGFPYAAAATAAGPATGLACAGCVGTTDLGANLALAGDTTVTGSLTACTAGSSSCGLGVGDAVIADQGDGWLGVLVDQGVRVRSLGNDAWRPLHVGALATSGDVIVGGGLALTGSAGLGTTGPTQKLDVRGSIVASGALRAGFTTTGSSGYYPEAALMLRDTGFWVGVVQASATPWVDSDSFVFNTPSAGRHFAWTVGGPSAPLMLLDTAGRLGIGTAAPEAPLHVVGAAKLGAVDATSVAAGHVKSTTSVQIGNDTGACDTAKAGALRFTGTAIELCSAGEWRALSAEAPSGDPSTLGTTDNPGKSCLHILELNPVATDGPYWIRADGTTTSYQLYCDMTRNGGGWTLIMKDDKSSNADCTAEGTNTGALASLPNNTVAVLPQQWYNQLDPDAGKIFWFESTQVPNKNYFLKHNGGYAHYSSVPNDTSWYDKTSWGASWVGPANLSGYGTTNGWGPYCHNPNGCLPEHAITSCVTPGIWWNYGVWTGTFESGRLWARGEIQTKAWMSLAGGALGRQENPATSCRALKLASPSLPDGAYWIRPLNEGVSYQLWCDMTRNGGGWTLINKDDGGSNADCTPNGYRPEELDTPDVDVTSVLPVTWYNRLNPGAGKTFWIESVNGKNYFFKYDNGYAHYGSVGASQTWYDKTNWSNGWTGPAVPVNTGTTNGWGPYCHTPAGCLAEHAMSSCATPGYWFNWGIWNAVFEKGRMWAL